jgi:hypothetical protein
LTLGKAPFSATFRPVLDDILRVFWARLTKRAQMGADLMPFSARERHQPRAGRNLSPLQSGELALMDFAPEYHYDTTFLG